MSSAPEANIRFVCVGRTDVGRVREHNEDNFLVANLAGKERGKSGEVLSGAMPARGLFLVVADGMGGAAAGEVASQMAVDILHGEFVDADMGGTIRSEANVIALLEGAIHKANEAIFKLGSESKDHQGMGTTLTAAVVLGDSLYLSQVGDSRGYILRKGKLVQMTRDQSLIGQLIEEGTLTEEQAEKLGGKNIILQALGVEETLKIDSKRYDLLRGDTLLLCSDGLSGMAPDAKLEEILGAEPDLGKATEKLIAAANEGGGKDNITCILGRFEGEGLREPLSPLTDAEKAGGSFRAPPPPKSQAGRNAVIGTVAALAIIGGILFRPRPKTVFVKVAPVAAKVSVKGPEGFKPPDPMDCPAGGEVTFELPKDQEFTLVVEAPGYLQDPRPLSTKVDSKEIRESFTLVRIPGKSLDLVPPVVRGKPLAGVRVQLVPGEGQPEVAPLDVTDAPEFATKFPAGEWTAKATRKGFRAAEVKFSVASEEAKVVPLALEEETGDLEVTDLPAGAEVLLLEDGHPVTDAPVTVLATRSTGVQKVRATDILVRAKKAGYEFTDRSVSVGAGKANALSFGSTKGSVLFKVPVDGELRFEMGGKKVPAVFHAAQGEKRALDPGTWKCIYIAPDATESTFDLVVEPGQVFEKEIR
jgi:serine/threonine protein phosphatase PrpC